MRQLKGPWQAVFVLFSALGVVLAASQIFSVRILGKPISEISYFYALFLLFLSPVFLLYRAANSSSRVKVPWHDVLLFIVCVGSSYYMASQGSEMTTLGWAFEAPFIPTAMSFTMWVLVLEGVRRAGGMILFWVCAVFSLFPLFTGHLPGILQGYEMSLLVTARTHFLSLGSVMGIAMRSMAMLIVGFIVFAAVMQVTGAGKFFLGFALALLGSRRGGPAKVAVAASALFGTLSGSGIANVAATGSVTIPAMKKLGYDPTFAAAVEACSGTGGMLMPPVMCATAFIAASLMGVPYASVALAAAVPSILYYLAIYVQVDGYASRKNLLGIPDAERPRLRSVIKEGWFYIFAFLLLVLMLVYFRLEQQAPFYSVAALILLAQLKKKTRFTLRTVIECIASIGKIMVNLTAVIAAIGFIIGSLSVTGVAQAFAGEVTHLAGGNIALLLIIGAFVCYIMGFTITQTPIYLFLAIMLAPALVALGLNVMAVHLFILYWSLTSAFTPPVALVAFAAASLAEAEPMRVCLRSMRLAFTIYFIPFMWVINPALILQGSLLQIALAVPAAIVGLTLMASAIEGVLWYAGLLSWPQRIAVFIAGALLASPYWQGVLAGTVMLVFFILLRTVWPKLAKKVPSTYTH